MLLLFLLSPLNSCFVTYLQASHDYLLYMYDMQRPPSPVDHHHHPVSSQARARRVIITTMMIKGDSRTCVTGRSHMCLSTQVPFFPMSLQQPKNASGYIRRKKKEKPAVRYVDVDVGDFLRLDLPPMSVVKTKKQGKGKGSIITMFFGPARKREKKRTACDMTHQHPARARTIPIPIACSPP